MKKIAWTFAVLVAALSPQLHTVPAHAQEMTAVSITGNDSNTSSACGFPTPCQSIDVAIGVTASGGTVVCLDTGLFKELPVNITQSITIDCHDRLVAPVYTESEACEQPGININAAGGVVTLRNINISAATHGNGSFCGTNGITIEAAAKVIIEDCVIENFPDSGISVTTSADTVVNIKNTTITNSANGINLAPTGGTVNGSIDHTMIAQMSGDGITTNSGSAFFTVTNSVIANAAGVGVNSGGTGTALEVDSSSVSNNKTAFATSGGTIRISRNVIYDNNTNYSISGGTIATSGDNKVAVNGSTVPNGTITQQ
jgi:hypothetical protein